MRVRESVLRVAGRVLVHSRRVVLIVNTIASKLWSPIWGQLQRVRVAEN